MLFLFQNTLIRFFDGGKFWILFIFIEKISLNDFIPTMKKIYVKMFKVERLKTLPPKYSKAIKGLVKFLDVDKGLKEEMNNALQSSMGTISGYEQNFSKMSDSLHYELQES